MRHINQYPVWPNGWRKKQSDEYGPLVELYDARYALDPRTLASANPAINPWGVPKFLWRGGATPIIAPDPATNLAAAGGVVQTGQVTPYQYPDGTDATCDVFAVNAYRADTVRTLSPTLTNDIVCTVKFRRPYYNTTTTNALFGNRSGGAGFNGFGIYTSTVGGYGTWYARVGASTGQDDTITTLAARSWTTYTALYDRTTHTGYGFANAYSGGSLAFPAGSLVGDGISIGAWVNGVSPAHEGMAIEWVACWYDDGIFASWSADTWRLLKRLNMEAMGLRETLTNSKYWLYTGTSAEAGFSYRDHNDRWAFAYGDSHGPLAAGNPKGLVLQPGGRVLSPGTAYNFDPTGVGGWTATGGVLSVVNDAAALAAAKAEIWGPSVYSFVNATGAPQTIYCGSSTVAAYYKFFVIARYAAGAGATLGLREVATGNYTPMAAINDGYNLSWTAYTSIAAGWQLAIQTPNGCTLYFIGHSGLGGGGGTYGLFGYPIPFRTSPWDTLSPAGETHTTTEHTPSNVSGSYILNIAPVNWGGLDGRAVARVLRSVGGATALLFNEDLAPGGWAMTDGTTQLQMAAAYAPVANAYQNIWMAWSTGAGRMYLKDTANSVSLVTAAYDGAMPFVGALEPYPNGDGGCFALKYLEVRQLP